MVPFANSVVVEPEEEGEEEKEERGEEEGEEGGEDSVIRIGYELGG